jgi:hypothetical protein
VKAVPIREGAYWGMWKVSEESTPPAHDYTPSRLWEVIEVMSIDGELVAYVPGVPTGQSLENFHWAAQGALLPPPNVPISLEVGDDLTARAYARYKAMTPEEREEFIHRKKANA